MNKPTILKTERVDDIPLLNDTSIGGATTLGSGVKCAVVCQMTALSDTTRLQSSYRFHDRSEVVATATDRLK